jgi:hypothetical protein
MDSFTLVMWLYIGMRYDEVRVPSLDRAQCVELLHAAESSRYLAYHQTETGRKNGKGHCLGANGTIAPSRAAIEPVPICAHGGGPCSWPILPGRRRI